MSFVRSSKCKQSLTADRHVFGKSSQRDACFDNLKVTRSAWDTNLVTANPLFISINLEAGGGGAFAVIPHTRVGKLPENLPVFNGHGGAVLDTDFNPFNDHVVASASEAMIWTIPEGGPAENISTPAATLAGHGRKVGHVLFNPVAENILATSSADFTVKIWDISTGQEKMELNGHSEIIQAVSWSWEGNMMVTTCKDKKIRVFDVRSKSVVQECTGHQGVKGSRCVTMGNSTYFTSTGFSKTSERQVNVWDFKNLSAPLKELSIDNASGMLIPVFDGDTNVLYLAGKGDGNIRYYEWIDDDKGLHYLAEYKSSEPQRGIGFLPKRACTINEVEVMRAFKVHTTMVEPISFKVPRKSDAFQSDLFPPTIGPEPAMSAAEWMNGKTCGPRLINLEEGFTPAPIKVFETSAPATRESSIKINNPAHTNGNADVEGLHREIAELKVALANKDLRIRQLEAKLGSS